MLYCDQTSSAESLVSQIGAAKAGVSVVTFDEKDNEEAFGQALSSSKAKGLILTPGTETTEGNTKGTFLSSLMPELATMYPGQELNLSKFPHLQHIIQTGHQAMRGVNKFRDLAVYTSPNMSTRQIPSNDADAVSHIVYKDGKAAEWSSSEIVAKSADLWDGCLSKAGSDTNPIFMACDIENPLGFSAFLACSSNFKKVFIPGTFNMTQMLQSVQRQGSDYIMCDEDFYSVQLPPAKKAEYQQMCSAVKNVLVSGSASGSSDLFPNAKATSKDKYDF